MECIWKCLILTCLLFKDEKHKDKSNRFEDMEETLKKQTRKVEKIQESIEKRIFKHTEL